MLSVFLGLLLQTQPSNPVNQGGLPQTIPFKFYTRLVYGFGRESEEEEGPEDPADLWWDAKVDGTLVGAPKNPGQIDVVRAARAAWGMKWWGESLQQFDWKEHADELLNLTLVAPKVSNFHVATASFAPLKWGDESSLAGDAQVAYWYLRWLKDWPDSKQKTTMLGRVAETIEACASADDSGATATPFEREHVFRLLGEATTSKVLPTSSKERASYILARTLFLRIEPAARLTSYKTGPLNDAPVLVMREAARTNDKKLFEQGVTALKSRLRQLNEPTLVANGIRVPEQVRVGSMAPVTNGGKFLVPGDWTFERYEGQLMASFAEVTQEFGGYYVDDAGWAVGIDGCKASPKGPVSLLSSNPFPYGGKHEIDVIKPGQARKTVDVILVPSISRMILEGGKLIAVPGAYANRAKPSLSGTFFMQGSTWKRKAKVGLVGFECEWPKNKKSAVFTFKGQINGTPVSYGPVRVTGV